MTLLHPFRPLAPGFVDYRVEETIQRRRQLMSLPQTSLDEADFRTDLIPIRRWAPKLRDQTLPNW